MSKDLSVVTLLDYYGAMLTERQRDVVGYYYCDDLSLAEIAENEGVTRQAVSDLLRRAVQQLEDMEQRLGFVAKIGEIESAVSLIKTVADSCGTDEAKSIVSLCDVILKD